MSLRNQKKVKSFQFFFVLRQMRKYGTMPHRVRNRVICREWREKAALLRMTADDVMLNYRSTHVHAYKKIKPFVGALLQCLAAFLFFFFILFLTLASCELKTCMEKTILKRNGIAHIYVTICVSYKPEVGIDLVTFTH